MARRGSFNAKTDALSKRVLYEDPCPRRQVHVAITPPPHSHTSSHYQPIKLLIFGREIPRLTVQNCKLELCSFARLLPCLRIPYRDPFSLSDWGSEAGMFELQ